MVPQSCLKMNKISDEVRNFIEKIMKTWSGIDSRRKNLN